MLGQYKCINVSHNYMPIQGVCQNKLCKLPSRRICFQCIKDHQKNDENFDHSDIKIEQELQQMINEFKYYNVDRMNNIALQCQIQQYLLNIEMIEFVKLWNYKYHKIHEILVQLQQFNDNQWKQISVQNYLDNEKNISIVEYLQQHQQKLLHLDDLKDIYIKEIIKEKKYDDINVNTEMNKLSIDLIQTINIYKNQLFSYITQNDLFKQKNQQNEEFIITIFELMLQQGYDLKTDALYVKFQVLIDTILDKQIVRFKSQYIQIFNIVLKLQNDKSERANYQSSLNQSLEIQGKYAKSYRIKGLLYLNDNKQEESIKMFDHAIKIDPKYCQAYINKGCSLNYLQKYDQAIEMFDKAIKIDPKYVHAYYGKGYSLQNLQKYEQAIEMYDQVIKIDPKFVHAHYGKGYSLHNLQKQEQAIKMYDQAIKINPKYVQAYYGKGFSLKNLQKYEQAIEMFDKAIKIDPKSVHSYYNKADSLYQLKLYKQSKDTLQQGLQLDPKDQDMIELIKLCNQKLKT